MEHLTFRGTWKYKQKKRHSKNSGEPRNSGKTSHLRHSGVSQKSRQNEHSKNLAAGSESSDYTSRGNGIKLPKETGPHFPRKSGPHFPRRSNSYGIWSWCEDAGESWAWRVPRNFGRHPEIRENEKLQNLACLEIQGHPEINSKQHIANSK